MTAWPTPAVSPNNFFLLQRTESKETQATWTKSSGLRSCRFWSSSWRTWRIATKHQKTTNKCQVGVRGIKWSVQNWLKIHPRIVLLGERQLQFYETPIWTGIYIYQTTAPTTIIHFCRTLGLSWNIILTNMHVSFPPLCRNERLIDFSPTHIKFRFWYWKYWFCTNRWCYWVDKIMFIMTKDCKSLHMHCCCAITGASRLIQKRKTKQKSFDLN